MDIKTLPLHNPALKTKALSTHHVDVFELVLNGKSAGDINRVFGYSNKPDIITAHSRIVMLKLLRLENLPAKAYIKQLSRPRNYCFWWKSLLIKHKDLLMVIAIRV